MGAQHLSGCGCVVVRCLVLLLPDHDATRLSCSIQGMHDGTISLPWSFVASGDAVFFSCNGVVNVFFFVFFSPMVTRSPFIEWHSLSPFSVLMH